MDKEHILAMINRPSKFPFERAPFDKDGQRLWFRPVTKSRMAPGPITLGNRRKRLFTHLRHPLNMLITARLYRWARTDYHPIVNRARFTEHTFEDVPQINVMRVGVMVTDAVQYPTIYRNRGINFWRFHHRLDILYGLERQLLSWLEPFDRMVENEENPINSVEDLQERLQEIIKQKPHEDLEFIYQAAVEYGSLWSESEIYLKEDYQ